MTLTACSGSPVEPDPGNTSSTPTKTPPTSPTNARTFLSFISEPGEYVGNGETHTYALADGNWTALGDAGTSRTTTHVQIRVEHFVPNDFWWWEIHFSAPASRSLALGAYEDARGWLFNPPAQPGLRFSGTGRSCGAEAGRFVITELVLGATNSLDRFRATFEQRCNARTLTGEVAIVADPWR